MPPKALAPLCALAATIFALEAMAQVGRSYARSMVISQQGIAATSQVLASQAGAQILAQGGSAVDAAIACNALLGLTEPMMTGIGGDLFALYREGKTGKLTGLNSSGAAPQALTPEFLAKQGIKLCPRAGFIRSPCRARCGAGMRCTSASASFPGRFYLNRPSPYAEQGFR